jgi:thiosulfate/3-mercaptopyruvate sulfurtransferase
MLPSEERFAQAMSRLGVADDTVVVTYSSANHWWATRLWWMLRVFGHQSCAVMNGGFQKWQRESRAVEQGPPKPHAPARFTARFEPEQVADKKEVLDAIRAGDICTVNALRPEQHAGTGGTTYGRLGHIAGSINIAAIHAVDADNCFKPAAELRALFAPALAKSIAITYCGGGIAATSAALVLTMLGHPHVKVYDASLTEWAADPSLPMQTGA